MQYWPGSAVWVLVAQRIYTCLHIRFLQHAFQDVGSVSCCCFIRFFAWCRKNSLCHARSCSHVQMKRSRPCKKRCRLGFACNAFGWWWNVFWTNESVNWCFIATCQLVTVMFCSPSRRMQRPPQIPVRQRGLRGCLLPLWQLRGVWRRFRRKKLP